LNLGGQADDVMFEHNPGFKHAWTKITALMIQIEELENDPKFAGFLASSAAEFADLKRR
jgi:hypothetical protein